MKVLFVIDTIAPVTAAPAVRILSFVAPLRSPPAQVLGGTLATLIDLGSGLHTIERGQRNRGLGFVFDWLMFLFRMRRRLSELGRDAAFDAIVISVPQFELLHCTSTARRHCRVLAIDIRDSLGFIDYEKHIGRVLPHFIARMAGSLIRRATQRRLNRALDAADLITVANEGIARELQEWSDKLTIIPNGVDTRRFRPADARASEDIPLELVYMGNFSEKDQFGWLLNLLPEFSGRVRLNLIGTGRQKQVLLRELQSRSIIYLDFGRIPHESVPNLLARMDVGFLLRAGYAESSIPVAFYEFAAMNIPSVCNDVGLAAEFVRHYRLGYVVNSENEFRSLLVRLTENRGELDDFRTLHDLACREFSREVHAKRLASRLQYLLEKSHRASSSG